jgi:hypothetical protein
MNTNTEQQIFKATLIDEDWTNSYVGQEFESPSKTLQIRKEVGNAVTKGLYKFENYKFHIMKSGDNEFHFWIPVDVTFSGTDKDTNSKILRILIRAARRLTHE